MASTTQTHCRKWAFLLIEISDGLHDTCLFLEQKQLKISAARQLEGSGQAVLSIWA